MSSRIGLSPEQVARAFPFHVAIAANGRIVQVGASMARVSPQALGSLFSDQFTTRKPTTLGSYDALLACVDAILEIVCRHVDLTLSGQVMQVDGDRLLLLLSPRITAVEQMSALGLSLSDFAHQDILAEFLMLVRTKDLALADSEQLSFSLFQQRQALHDTNQQLASEIAERQRIEFALAERENVYRSVLNGLREAVVQTDADGRCRYLNPAWFDISGYEVQEALGTMFLDGIHPDDRDRNLEVFAPMLAGEVDSCRHDVRYLRRDGGFVWVDLYARQMKDAEGNYIGMVGTLNDVTERHEHEDRLMKANAALSRASRLKDEFLSNMSHELRTPLNNILGIVESLSEHIYGALEPRQAKALALVEASGRHLLDLINDILDLSKIEAGKMTLDIMPTSVAQLCSAALALVRNAAHQKQLQVTQTISPEATTLLVDQRGMKQVLVNLLSNAVKFTPTGGTVRLDVSVDAKAGTMSFAVIDSGIGIAEADQGRLFQPFTQVDSSLSRQYNGTGLGLALVRRMVELHEGGRVTLQSEAGKGSCFTVTLPWTPTTPKAVVEKAAESSGASCPIPIARTSQRRLLVADDTETNVLVLRQYLEAKGYEVLTASDGLQAVASATEHHPDLIIMDVQMPELDGLSAIRRLRAQPDTATIPIFAFTALAMSGDRERCLDAGANDYFSKPVKLSALATAIRSQLDATAAPVETP